MITEYSFTNHRFKPTAGEVNDAHDDFINPDIFARELAEFLISGLAQEGYAVKDRIVEDWGNWIEVQHDGKFALAVCCANLEDLGNGLTRHRVTTDPSTPHIRKFLRKIDVQPAVQALSAALSRILTASPDIIDITTG